MAFIAGSAPAGLDPPRGMLLLGVQGCGKSMLAKATAAGFGVPLLRLDVGALYNKYHGETEANLRQALASAEQLAPCVLWMDEIDLRLADGQAATLHPDTHRNACAVAAGDRAGAGGGLVDRSACRPISMLR